MPDVSPALLCEWLSYRYGEHLALDGVDLRIERGEIFGLLGPNGAGKTTTIRIANTLLPVQEGRIEVLGFDVSRAKTAVRRRIGYVPQQLSIEAALTGRQNVASHVNPLTYEVDALRGLLIGTSSHLLLDFAVLAVALVVGIATASSLVGRLAR